jgi:hypothetical protein
MSASHRVAPRADDLQTPLQPHPQLKPVEPKRRFQERLEEQVGLRGLEPRLACKVASVSPCAVSRERLRHT